MKNIALEPWYRHQRADGTVGLGYGGAWGEVGIVDDPHVLPFAAINTGPLGPPWKHPAPFLAP